MEEKNVNEEIVNVCFISVRNEPNSLNRNYSDSIINLCQKALDENRPQGEPEYKISPADLRINSSDLRKNLAEALLNTKRFIVLLDEWDDNKFNPNVWYECGVISTIPNAKISFIAKSGTNIPFDIGNGVNVVRISIELMEIMKYYFDLSSFNPKSAEFLNKEEANGFKDEFRKAFKKATNPFTSDYESVQLSKMGFCSLLDFFEKSGIEHLLNPDNGSVEYIDGEEDAFRALTDAVKKAKYSLRTSRFAGQSIVTDDARAFHDDFMKALKSASYNVNRFDRIVCMNTEDKWLDVWKALSEFNPETTIVYLRKKEYSIKFELVVIDEEVSFIHFYLPDNSPKDQEKQTDERIRSTLKITGVKMSRKLANIFDRLHHRDYNQVEPQELSRTLLGVVEKDGSLTEDSKKQGYLSLNDKAKSYKEISSAMRGSRQLIDATAAIKTVNSWNLQEEERNSYQNAMKKYFEND